MTRNYRFGQCTGIAKTTGEQCEQPATRNGKCWRHGGATPDGPNAGRWIHGLYSEALQRAKRSGLMETYERVLNDDELLSLNDEIALTKSRIFELVAEGQETPDYKQLVDHYKKARNGYQLQNEERFIEHFNELGDLLYLGAAEQERRREIRAESDTLRKLNATEQQRRVKMVEYIEAEHVVTILARLGVIISMAGSIEGLKAEAIDFIQEIIGPHTRADYISADDRAEIG